MVTRRVRDHQHRRGLLVGIGVSVALHAVVFGALNFQTADGGADAPGMSEEQVLLDVAMEIVEIREVTEITVEMPTSTRPIVASPAPVDRPEPASASMGAASASAVVIASITPADLLAATALTSPNLTMRPRFAAQREIAGAMQQIGAPDPHAGHDHGEEEDEGDGFWQKLGNAWGKVPMGSGGGKVCKPPTVTRPPAVIRESAATQ